MFRDILSSRAIQVGIAFFVLVVGGSLLYSWHASRNDQEKLARTDQFLQQLKDKKETRTAQDATVPTDANPLKHTETSMETDNTVPQMSKKTEAFIADQESLDLTDAFLPNDSVSEDETVKVRVSPHGFGPYPEIPADYPEKMTPTWVKNENPSRDHELMHRVLIKLWNQGDKNVSGAVIKRGLVYPLYPNTTYVRYREIEMPDGTVERFISSASGPLGTKPFIPAGGGLPVLPEGVTAVDMDNAGINPYDFLDLR